MHQKTIIAAAVVITRFASSICYKAVDFKHQSRSLSMKAVSEDYRKEHQQDEKHDKIGVAVIQMCSVNNKVENLFATQRLISEAVAKSQYPTLDMICLPECCAFMGATRSETVTAAEDILPPFIDGTKPSLFVKKFEQYLTTWDAELQSELKDGYDGIEPIHYIRCLCLLAAKHRVWLSVGGFPEIVRSDSTSSSSSSSPSSATATGRIYNTHLMIDPCGEVVCPSYRKLHLFDSPLAGLKESELTAAGDRAVLLENIFEQWTLAPTICYDLRFPLLYEGFSSKGGADIVLVPSAFTPATGRAHWEVLLRARAIENQCYVLAAAQSGEHNPKRTSYGHSIIIDPWGSVLASLHEEREGIIYGLLDHAILTKVRTDMPVTSHKRKDLYYASSDPPPVEVEVIACGSISSRTKL